jgi:hypothetical protein
MTVAANTISAPTGNPPPILYWSIQDGGKFFTRAKPGSTKLSMRRKILEELKENNTNMSHFINDSKTVFADSVKACLTKNGDRWDGNASAEVLRAIITNLKDSKGEAITLTPVEVDAITIACRPTFEVQVRLMKRILESRGVLANADTEKNIERVINATKFTKELLKAGLIKETGASDLKDLLG